MPTRRSRASSVVERIDAGGRRAVPLNSAIFRKPWLPGELEQPLDADRAMRKRSLGSSSMFSSYIGCAADR
jgi:hypothetical protein